jgi:hypothetical protein
MADQWKYAKCVECERELHKTGMFSLPEFEPYICWDCVEDHNGNGKFEAYRHHLDLKPLATALVLNYSTLHGSDDFMFDDGWGSCARLGKYLLLDSSGFVTYEEYRNEEAAENEFNQLYNMGWGASPDDAYIASDGTVSFDGKKLDVWAPQNSSGISDRRRIARVRLESMKTGYYPNLWMESDHGNLTLIPY